MVETATIECGCAAPNVEAVSLGAAMPAFECKGCGKRSHNAVCVDADGKVECVCGLDDCPPLLESES